MSFFWTLIGGLITAVVGVLSFVLGRIYSQSETILVEKRRVYEEFLSVCPRPNQAYRDFSDEELEELHSALEVAMARMSLYCSTEVSLSISVYLDEFQNALQALNPNSPALDPAFKKLAKAHNDVILEMRRDALAWSVFAYRGKSRLPDDAIERAKMKALE